MSKLVAIKSRGRPTIFNQDTVHKLEQAFAMSCTVEEACSISGVSRSAYYKRLENDRQFMDKMERAKLFMIIQARHTVCKAIRAGDIKTSIWYLERKRKDEFGINLQVFED
jgi:ACT domain-containing protein